MAKYKGSSKRPQAKHKKNKKSQHDKRKRLQSRNPKRKRTTKAKVSLTGTMRAAVSVLQAVMDRRIAFRLTIVVAGMLLADDRRTASAWFVAAGVQDDWDRFYDCLTSVGRISEKLATAVLGLVVQKFAPGFGDRILLGMDDSPTSRYGRHVEGAGIHHNPTPGPAGEKWLYGHNWVALAWLADASGVGRDRPTAALDALRPRGRHPETGGKIWLGISHQASTWRHIVDLVHAVDQRAGGEGEGLAGGRWRIRGAAVSQTGTRFAYRYRQPLAKGRLPLRLAGNTRSPPTRAPPIYGKNKISLAKRAGHKEGWETITYDCRGVGVTRQYKTFLATSELVSGQIRVVILRYEDGSWAPYFCTDTSAEVARHLGNRCRTLGDRGTLPRCEGGSGAGQQQVRNVWSSVGCWHLNQWMYTLVELCCWDVPQSELSDRQARSWDNPDRRPSHADRRRSISRQMLQKQFLAVLPNTPDRRKFRNLIASLLSLCV